MWRHFEGVKEPSTMPPAKKKKKAVNQQDQQGEGEPNQPTGEKPKYIAPPRIWREEWRVDDSGKARSWLKYDSVNKRMSCVLCQKYAKPQRKSNNFVIGTKNMKLETIKDHENSGIHDDSIKASQPVLETPVVRAATNMRDRTKEKINNMFRTVHALAKNGRPMRDFTWQCKLDEKKGLHVGETYRTPHEARVFLGYIPDAEKGKIKARVEGTRFVAILSDGSTCTAVNEQELVYFRSCIGGRVESKFVGIEAVSKADAESITNAIKKVMGSVSQWEDIQDKLVAVVTDGAAVMVGVRNGVVQRLRGDRAYVLGVHCMAHRLELSFQDAVKLLALFKKVEELLSNLYAFYHKSPLNRANLKDSYRALGMTPLMPTRVGGTRWLAHLVRAIDHYLRGYPAIIQHLDQISSPDARGVNAIQANKAKNMVTVAKDGVVLRFIGFLHDTVSHLSRLSQTLQKSDLSIAEAHMSMASTHAILEKYKTRPGPMMKATNTDGVYQGVTLCGGGGRARGGGGDDERALEASQEKLLDRLSQSLSERFKDSQTELLMATRLVNLKTWPKQREPAFGDAQVDALVAHFSPVLSCPELIPDEWTLLKARLYTVPEQLVQLTWERINQCHGDTCPNILELFDVLLTIPASTADCERGFNIMKQVKSDWRSRLSPETLTNLMLVQLSSPSIEDFNPSDAVQLWHTDSVRGRRPTFMDQETQSDESDSDSEHDGQ